MNERWDELIEGEIDGTNTAAEREELAALLQADAGARRHRDELRESLGLLEQLAMVDPPAGLRGRIAATLAAAPAPGAPGRRARAGWPEAALREAFGWSRRPSVGVAFAAGILLAVILISVARQMEGGPQSPPHRDVLGVVLPGGAPVVASFEHSATGASGAWRGARQGRQILLRLDLVTERPLDATVQAGPEAVCIGYLGGGAPAGGVEIAGGRIELRGLSSGRHDLLFLQSEPGPLAFTTLTAADGAAIDEGSFTVGRGRRD